MKPIRYAMTCYYSDGSGTPETYPVLLTDKEKALCEWVNDKEYQELKFTKVVEDIQDSEPKQEEETNE